MGLQEGLGVQERALGSGRRLGDSRIGDRGLGGS